MYLLSADRVTPGTVKLMSDDKHILPEDSNPEEPKINQNDNDPKYTEILAQLEASLFDVDGLNPMINVDATEVDPIDECPHDWYELGFLPLGDGLNCADCGESWHLDDVIAAGDALMVVWNATKTALESTQERIGALEKLIAARLTVRRCEACNTWSDELVQIDNVFACSIHVGDAVADYSIDDDTDALGNVADWSINLDLSERLDLEGVVLWERLIASSFGFASLIGDTDDEASLARPVELHQTVASLLQLPTELKVGDLVTNLANLLDTDHPTTRQGGAFLLSLLWSSLAATEADSLDLAALKVVEQSIPMHERNRMTVAIDLCGQSMPDGTSFMASLANEVLTVVAQRAATQLLTLFHSENL